MNLTTLARKLEPYIRTMIREMLGDMNSSGMDTGLTWIHGTGFLQDDKTGNRAVDVADFQMSRSNDDEVAAGAYSGIPWGYDNKTTADGDYGAAAGGGAVADNRMQFAIGDYINVAGDAQASRFPITGSYSPSDAWETFASVTVRTDTAWTFLALIIGIEQGAARTYSYQILGCVENDGGTISIKGQTVTTIFEDDANYDVQVAVDDPNDEMDFQVIDSGNNGRTAYWTIHLLTAEVTYPA